MFNSVQFWTEAIPKAIRKQLIGLVISELKWLTTCSVVITVFWLAIIAVNLMPLRAFGEVNKCLPRVLSLSIELTPG